MKSMTIFTNKITITIIIFFSKIIGIIALEKQIAINNKRNLRGSEDLATHPALRGIEKGYILYKEFRRSIETMSKWELWLSHPRI